ncbi:MAG TPA: acyltransferase [Pyrinomonadaceae bacterium]|nr:acyltransferase [Pyrinomonadaceae bacterium]
MTKLGPHHSAVLGSEQVIAPQGASGLGALPSVNTATQAQLVTRTRLKELDVLRAVAVLLVLCSHVPSFDWLQRCGWIGVDLFFVLSGFLVSGLLYSEYKKHGTLSPKRFLVRRGLKIYPAFYTFVIGSVLLMLAARMAIPSDRLLAEILFVQNYYGGLWGHTWSLCIEEHFYLLLTAALYLLWRRPGNRATPFDAIPKITLLVAVGVLAARVLTYILIVPYDFQTHFKPTHLRIDSLLFGVCLAYFHHFHEEKFANFIRRHRLPIILFGLAAIAPAVVFPAESMFMSTIGFTLLYLGFGCVLLFALHRSGSRAWSRVFGAPGILLARVGAYSYSVYLWHLVVATLGITLIRRAYTYASTTMPQGTLPQQLHPLVEFAAYVVASVAVGIVTAKLVEMPVLRLRDRYFPGRS